MFHTIYCINKEGKQQATDEFRNTKTFGTIKYVTPTVSKFYCYLYVNTDQHSTLIHAL